jgi:hypothetical protein
MEQHVEWTSPAPFWNGAFDPADPASRRAFRQPALLRFEGDNFMDEYLATLNQDPGRLPQFAATYETWRRPLAAPDPLTPQLAGLPGRLARLRAAAQRKLDARTAVSATVKAPKPLKLYQPAHARYYLAAGCLVCRMPGLPDRRLDTGQAERVSFVVRRLQLPAGADPTNFQPADATELALTGTASGTLWQQVTGTGAQLWPGEEQLPLSPATYQDDSGRRRRLFAGLVPVGKREAYFGASTKPPQTGNLADPRRTALRNDVISPWGCLLELVTNTNKAWTDTADTSKSGDFATQFANTRVQLKTMSWYILLDFSHYLEDNVLPVWNVINSKADALTDSQTKLVNTLNNSQVTYPDASKKSLASALVDIRRFDNQLELQNTRFAETQPNWPDFTFPLTAVFLDLPTSKPDPTVLALAIEGKPTPSITDLEATIVLALPEAAGMVLGPSKLVATTALNGKNAQGSDLFYIRFVFERPACGALTQPLVSEPTAAFQLAPFFDPDAPARPIRIAMPIDTSPAGLRKFDKNTAFVMSDTLCGQVKSTGGLSLGDLVLSVLPFPFHKGLNSDGNPPCADGSGSFGMVCSMSIPIITICAMILLFIIVKLFDLIFFWMPFFRICLPIPGLKAKEIQ